MKQSIHAKRMARQHKRASQQPKLNLVSLMDIFTILVFFLLVNSSDVEVLQNNKNIVLPASIAEQKPENNLVVMVSQQDVVVGGRQVADIASVLESDASDIPGLAEELTYLAERRKSRMSREALLDAVENGLDVTIMGDQSIPYTLLKKIMTTCAQSEYRNISLAVSQIPDESAIAPAAGAGG